MADQIESLEKNEVQSASYPAETLDNCVQIVNTIYNERGDSYVSSQEIYAITGKPRGTMVLKVASCVHYGLLINQYGKGYKVTDLFTQINLDNPNSARIVLLQSFIKPKLNEKLVERYNTKPIPPLQGLANTLYEDYGIHKNSCTKAAQVFLDNCKNLGIITNGRLSYFIPQSSGNGATLKSSDQIERERLETEKLQEERNESLRSPFIRVGETLFSLPIDLGTGRVAELRYPKDINENEAFSLRIWLEAALKAIESRHKRSGEENNSV